MHCSIVKSQTNALALIEPLILLNVFLSECCRGQLVMRSSLNENSDKTNMDQKTYDLKECLFKHWYLFDFKETKRCYRYYENKNPEKTWYQAINECENFAKSIDTNGRLASIPSSGSF